MKKVWFSELRELILFRLDNDGRLDSNKIDGEAEVSKKLYDEEMQAKFLNESYYPFIRHPFKKQKL